MYDFDKVIDRRHCNSVKWDVGENELPMWIADMDFPTAPPIIEAIQKKISVGALGYGIIPDEWNEAYINWWKTRHNLTIEKDWLIFTTGVVPAISTIVRKLTTPAEKVLIQTPVYNIFFNSIVNNGRYVKESPLDYDGKEYTMNFQRLEDDLSDPQVSMMILCNPHNPIGKIWSKEILAKVGELCHKYGVTVVSDGIHCDLTDPDHSYVPFISASEICKEISVTCIAPTKAFNIAGVNTAAVVVPNKFLRHKVWRALNTDEVAEPNIIAIEAAVAAFNEGGQWLDELREYFYANKQYAGKFIEENIPEIHLVPSDATYLLWLDCSKLTDDSVVFMEFIRKHSGLYVCEGAEYGEAGRKFLRVNVACPRSLVEDGMCRLADSVKAWKANRQ